MKERMREGKKERKKEKESYTLAVFVVNEVRDSERWANRQTDRHRQTGEERRNITFSPP